MPQRKLSTSDGQRPVTETRPIVHEQRNRTAPRLGRHAIRCGPRLAWVVATAPAAWPQKLALVRRIVGVLCCYYGQRPLDG